MASLHLQNSQLNVNDFLNVLMAVPGPQYLMWLPTLTRMGQVETGKFCVLCSVICGCACSHTWTLTDLQEDVPYPPPPLSSPYSHTWIFTDLQRWVCLSAPCSCIWTILLHQVMNLVLTLNPSCVGFYPQAPHPQPPLPSWNNSKTKIQQQKYMQKHHLPILAVTLHSKTTSTICWL